MVNLTFGEQVKIILSRKGMTIKQLAELVEQHTGKPMSRQNMTQRLGRDNFQEQDMRLIAEILGCKFTLSIMESEEEAVSEAALPNVESKASEVTAEKSHADELHPLEREVTIGELADMADEVAKLEEPTFEMESSDVQESGENELDEQALSEQESDANETDHVGVQGEEAVLTGEQDGVDQQAADEKALLRKGIGGYFRKITPNKSEAVQTEQSATNETSDVLGDINPYTGKEYKTNSVRMHPKRIGYVQVYDQEQHKWTDMTEWAFLGYQERKKALLGKDYEPPIYLD